LNFLGVLERDNPRKGKGVAKLKEVAGLLRSAGKAVKNGA
jgi:hypothetical protein